MNHYFFKERFNWIDTTDELILESSLNEDDQLNIEKEQFLCFLKKTVVYTTDIENSYYNCSVHDLISPSALEAASIMEEILSENTTLYIHNIWVIREGVYFDKTADIIIREFDHEWDSYNWIIRKKKKINIIINDLQLKDIFVYEVTQIHNLINEDLLIQKYFFHDYFLPSGKWTYKKLEFLLLNERKTDIICDYKNFRNTEGVILNKDRIKIWSNGKFLFHESNFYDQSNPTKLSTFINFATESTWQLIWQDIYKIYSPFLEKSIFSWDKQYSLPDLDLASKIQYAIEFVQNHITYVYDADFMNWYIPQSVEKTFQNKIWDCKAKSLLLYTFLKEIGVSSTIVLVNYNTDNILIGNNPLPSPFLFNHAIVRIFFNWEYYFVDPTIKNCSWTLWNRYETNFEHYFPIEKISPELQKRKQIISSILLYEEKVDIDLKNQSIVILIVYSNYLADQYRNNFHYMEKHKLIESELFFIASAMGLKFDTNTINDLFIQSSFEIISDNLQKNTFTVKFTGILNNIFSSKDNDVFRYYPNDFSELLYECREIPFEYFKFPFKRVINIKSPKVILKNGQKNLRIENEHFAYANIKNFKRKNVTINTDFFPRKIWYLSKPEDFDLLKKSTESIMNSNNWIGIQLSNSNFWSKIMYFFYVLLIINAFTHLLKPFLQYLEKYFF